MGYFRELGAQLHQRWVAVDRDEERFPEVADAVVDGLPPRDHFDRDRFIAEVLEPGQPATRQLVPLGAFGQPGLTVYYGHGFVIDVYYWLNSVSAIHNHPFCGLFTILEGFSVHAQYAVERTQKIGPASWIGDVRLSGLSLLTAGDRQMFSLVEHPLVHALIHVPVPSISMVIRTVRTVGYQRYLPPSLILPMDGPDEPAARQIALLQSLRAAGEPKHHQLLCDYLRHADFETAVGVLSGLWASCEDVEQDGLLDLLRSRHGRRVDALAPSFARALRSARADGVRTQLVDPELRLVASTLMLAETRRQCVDLLAQRSGQPMTLLHRFVDEAELFGAGEEASATIAHALADGEGVDGAVARLGREYGEQRAESRRADIARYCTSSIFAPLSQTDET